MKHLKSLSTLLALLAFAGAAQAEVKLPNLFSEGAVLQRGKRVPVWGTGRNGELVTVSLQGQRTTATTVGGRWMAMLKNLKAGGPYTLTVQGDNTIEVQNVLVGEVYVCSGQSNMEWPLTLTEGAQEAIAESADPKLHLFKVPQTVSESPLSEVNTRWTDCNPQTVENFSAVAYYMGRMLRQKLKVPVGLIQTAWGGTPAESWTRREIMLAKPELAWMVTGNEEAKKNYPAALATYQQAVETHKVAAEQAKAEGKTPPNPPNAPGNPVNAFAPTYLYNAMIAPLLPYGIRGAIWYQGESNAGRAYQYLSLFPTMIQNWRDDWLQGDFPFYFVQLAPFMKIEKEPRESAWAELREAQRQTLNLKNTGMAVITDVGEETDIHPRKKRQVGERLALWALAKTHNMRIEYSGPVYDSMEVKDGKAVLRFTHASGGLATAGDGTQGHTTDVLGFTLAGADGKFYNAQARILEGGRVEVSSSQVSTPVHVRYGWANFPVVNLFNRAGLPASPFRTDDLTFITKPR